jgi:hypothetical protein
MDKSGAGAGFVWSRRNILRATDFLAPHKMNTVLIKAIY